MNPIQSKWSKGNEIKDNGDIGELLIDGNSITFHINGYGDPFARHFVGKDDLHNYKVYTYGQGSADATGVFYHVEKAFLYNGENYKDFVGDKKIDGITSFSFEIPELANWLKLQSIKFHVEKDGSKVIHEKKLPRIIIKESNPKVYLKYESNLPFLTGNDKIEMTLRNAPRVFVEYEAAVDDDVVIGDLKKIMRFFALLIGRITNADDIRLKLTEEKLRMKLFVNHDFSHNTESSMYHIRHRTDVEKIIENLQSYFETWYSFAEDDRFTYLLNAYFYVKGKKIVNTDDLFITYCRILEGYHTRVTEEEINANRLSENLKEVLKAEEIRTRLSPLFEEAKSKYNPTKVAKWIANSFLGKVSLKDRIKRLDEKYLQVISANSADIVNTENIDEYYSKIANTRNYYSHYKEDNKGILSFREMYRTIELLEALIVIILLSKLGMSVEIIKSFMISDDKYWSILSHHRKDKRTNV